MKILGVDCLASRWIVAQADQIVRAVSQLAGMAEDSARAAVCFCSKA